MKPPPLAPRQLRGAEVSQAAAQPLRPSAASTRSLPYVTAAEEVRDSFTGGPGFWDCLTRRLASSSLPIALGLFTIGRPKRDFPYCHGGAGIPRRPDMDRSTAPSRMNLCYTRKRRRKRAFSRQKKHNSLAVNLSTCAAYSFITLRGVLTILCSSAPLAGEVYCHSETTVFFF